MVDEERVILMTRMAAFATREGRKDSKINEYFRSDYVGFEVVKSAISATIAFGVLFVVYLISDFEGLIGDFYNASFLDLGKTVLFFYLVTVVGYCFISYIVFSHRYARMRKRMKKYYKGLRKLRKMYERD
ncbi:hypothetical protein [Butyrivibrio sp. MC2013]|uniref:hypothetical protein n=1 Tax=Butyrivibrio sp. MC2013 TaxID=1280686 RepID=UPI00047BC79A|nr:hypothetical protein [Butyrivibrio sp. MC2013]